MLKRSLDRLSFLLRFDLGPLALAGFNEFHGQINSAVIHSRDDRRVSPKIGAKIAAAMPNASMVTLPTANHVPIDTEEAFGTMMAAVDDFLSHLPT